jgi:hypothetical protein
MIVSYLFPGIGGCTICAHDVGFVRGVVVG